jgi:hypothetical protein
MMNPRIRKMSAIERRGDGGNEMRGIRSIKYIRGDVATEDCGEIWSRPGSNRQPIAGVSDAFVPILVVRQGV